jgi:hypothetical protein
MRVVLDRTTRHRENRRLLVRRILIDTRSCLELQSEKDWKITVSGVQESNDISEDEQVRCGTRVAYRAARRAVTGGTVQ